MYDIADEVIYVGKAKNLKKRLASYFRSNITNSKTRALVAKIVRVEVTVTETETEALILENDLIKHHLPKYNVLLRDDKSYPYIFSVQPSPSPDHQSPWRQTGQGTVFWSIPQRQRRSGEPAPDAEAVSHSPV